MGDFMDNFDDDIRRLRNPLMIVAAVGESASDEGIQRARGGEQRAAAIAVLNTGRMRFKDEPAPVGVNQRVAFAALDLLAGVIAARPAAFRGFDALILSLAKDGCLLSRRTGWPRGQSAHGRP